MKYKIFILFLIFTSCNGTSKYEYNNNFSVYCSTDFDKIDLQAQTLTRQYLEGEKIVHFELTEIDKKYLFDLLIDKEIWTIRKTDLEDTCDNWIEPSNSFSLKIQMTKDENFKFYWRESLCSIPRMNQLEEFVHELYRILEKDEKIKVLSRTDILTM